MHPIQQSLLEFSKAYNLAQMTYRDIAKGIGLLNESPQKIKHHLLQLQKKGFIKVDRVRGVMEKTIAEPSWAKGIMKKASRIFSIPIIGTASCGSATIFAKENFKGFLRVSGKLIGQSRPNDLFAVEADGYSMNLAEISGKKIEDGDYVIVKKDESMPSKNEIVLMIVDNHAVLKRFVDDRKNDQIVLKSDSTFDYEPIYLHPDDEFFINGKVVGIIKKTY